MRHLRPVLAATLALCCWRPAAAATIPAPAAIPDPTAFLVVYIPDLPLAIDHLEQTAVAINPATPKGMMKMGLGGMLGDPELASFGKGPVAIVMAPGMPMPSFAVVVPSTNPQAYIDALAKTGAMGKAVGGNVVLAKLPDGLELGERVAAQLGAIGTVPVKGDIRVLLAFDKVMQSYGAFLTQMAMMAGSMGGKQPGQEQNAKLLPLYASILQMVGGEVAMHQVDVGFSAEAITIDSITAATAGSALAKALMAPVPCLLASEQRLGTDGGALMTSMCLNRATIGGYARHVVEQLLKRPEAKGVIAPETPGLIDLAMKGYSGDFAMRLRSGEAGGPAFTNQVVYQVDDGAAALEAHVKSLELMFSDTNAIGRMYQAMGMSYTLTRDARSVGAIKVHSVAMKLDAAKLPAGQAEQMKRFLMPSELAVSNGFMYFAQGAPVDPLLKPAGQGPVFKSRTAHGPGHSGYIDADPTGLAMMITQMMPFPATGEVVAKLRQIPIDQIITGAIDIDGGRIRSDVRVPTKPLADITKAFEGAARKPHHKGGAGEDPAEPAPKDGATLF